MTTLTDFPTRQDVVDILARNRVGECLKVAVEDGLGPQAYMRNFEVVPPSMMNLIKTLLGIRSDTNVLQAVVAAVDTNELTTFGVRLSLHRKRSNPWNYVYIGFEPLR